MREPGPGPEGSGPVVSWPVWILVGLLVDAVLWTPLSKAFPMRLGIFFPYWDVQWLAVPSMALLLCWNHVFLSPMLLLSRGRPWSVRVTGVLKGLPTACVAVLMGMFFGLAMAGLLILPVGFMVLMGGSKPFVILSLALCFAVGGAMTGYLAAALAQHGPHAPSLPKPRYFATGGAIAGMIGCVIAGTMEVMTPGDAVRGRDDQGQSHLLLLLMALPGLILTHPAFPVILSRLVASHPEDAENGTL